MNPDDYEAVDAPDPPPDFTLRFLCNACGKKIRIEHVGGVRDGITATQERVQKATRDFHATVCPRAAKA